jgi:hypothetical protein
MRVAARAVTFFTTVAFQSQKQRVLWSEQRLQINFLNWLRGVRFELLDDLWPRVPRFLWGSQERVSPTLRAHHPAGKKKAGWSIRPFVSIDPNGCGGQI